MFGHHDLLRVIRRNRDLIFAGLAWRRGRGLLGGRFNHLPALFHEQIKGVRAPRGRGEGHHEPILGRTRDKRPIE